MPAPDTGLRRSLRRAERRRFWGGIGLTLTTADRAENERMRGVVERHIDRFAFREAPLSYEWTEQS